ncbi:hypothetical protein XCR1_1040002 [Xenorhabdus cabanillasii JM26]|uniref:Uncharacterized protein n=1 Tax=Xenorhabdus cabanillasii JM26 TaxID=1427517 RepID=W1IKN8_9GAMM|nr:transcriptional regulator [Xenorhabdus cabanillasii JM26]CDL79077.1 hypothetical protein XCR1_1040002 [Xenorhabdus cabanillasii JM26]
MAGIQFITDENGNKQAVVLPIAEYERLLAALDHDEDYVSIPYTKKGLMIMKPFLMKSSALWLMKKSPFMLHGVYTGGYHKPKWLKNWE